MLTLTPNAEVNRVDVIRWCVQRPRHGLASVSGSTVLMKLTSCLFPVSVGLTAAPALETIRL